MHIYIYIHININYKCERGFLFKNGLASYNKPIICCDFISYTFDILFSV